MDAFKVNSWRVRERVLMSLFMMLGQKDTISPEIIADMNKLITQRKSLERNKAVLLITKHAEWVKE